MSSVSATLAAKPQETVAQAIVGSASQYAGTNVSSTPWGKKAVLEVPFRT